MTSSDEEVDPILAWLEEMSAVEMPSGAEAAQSSSSVVVETVVAVLPSPVASLYPTAVPGSTSEARRRAQDTYGLWADPVKELMAPVRTARGKQVQNALIASSCSGVVSEGKALTRLDVDHEFLYLCDPAVESWNFVKVNGPRRPHFFRDLKEIAANGRGFCFDHSQVCEVPKPQPPRRVTSKVAGWSCGPYSTSRNARGQGTTCHSEAGLWESWLAELIRLDADEGWAENVFGILHRESRLQTDAPVKKMIEAAARDAPQYHMAIYFVDAWDTWICTRRRVYIHALHERCGGRESHQRMDNYVQACFYKPCT